MPLSIASFENPPRLPVPSEVELRCIGALGATFQLSHRTELMEEIGRVLNIPKGGWSLGISRLYDGKDIRLVWLLRRLARGRHAGAVSSNLQNARRFVDADTMLTLIVASRENVNSIDDVSMKPIETWTEGGLDYLWLEKDKLGLPPSITNNWRKARPFVSGETNRMVYPAIIPARDQVIAYAAQMRSSYERCFHRFYARMQARDMTVWIGCRVATLVWKAYAFLAPGGGEYNPKKGLRAQLGQQFGCYTALGYVASSLAPGETRALDRILTDDAFNGSEWVRIAKVRVAEALFLELILQDIRDLRGKSDTT